MKRMLLSSVALVVCLVANGRRAAVAQGTTGCDSPCKVIHLPLVGPRGAVCDSPCRLINLPLVTQTAGTSQASMPFIVGKISADSFDRVTGRTKGPPDATRTYYEYQVDKPAKPAPGSPQPVYPESLLIKKVEGDFVASFIVDTAGRVDVASFTVLKRGHPLFIESVREALPRMRFVPAEIAGVKVRQVVQRPFVFTLPR